MEKSSKKNNKKLAARSKGKSTGVTESAPVAISSKNVTKNAKVEYSKDGKSCCITHRERIGTILGSTSFTVQQSYAVNPGQSATFPWLSGIANRFESYSFDSLSFEFKTKTATTATGDVILTVDYDASDAAPTDSIQAEAYDETTSGAPWQNVTHICKRGNLQKMKMNFVRGDSQPSSTDIKMYDIGNLFVCTENQASAALVGYLYVSYTVRFFTPQLRSNDIGVVGGLVTGATSMTAANPFGTGASVDSYSRGIQVNGASRFTFVNPGTYTMTFNLTGTVISAMSKSNGSGLYSSVVQSIIVNSGQTACSYVLSILTSEASAYIDITATATTITGANCWIASAPYGSLAFSVEGRVDKNLATEKFLNKEACTRRALLRIDGVEAPCPSGCFCSRRSH